MRSLSALQPNKENHINTLYAKAFWVATGDQLGTHLSWFQPVTYWVTGSSLNSIWMRPWWNLVEQPSWLPTWQLILVWLSCLCCIKLWYQDTYNRLCIVPEDFIDSTCWGAKPPCSVNPLSAWVWSNRSEKLCLKLSVHFQHMQLSSSSGPSTMWRL